MSYRDPILSKAEKKEEIIKQIEKQLDDMRPELLKKLDSILVSGAVPEHFYQKDNWLLCMAIMHAYCESKPFLPLNVTTKKEFANLLHFM